MLIWSNDHLKKTNCFKTIDYQVKVDHFQIVLFKLFSSRISFDNHAGMEKNEDIGSVLFIDWIKNSKLFSFFSKKSKKPFQMVKFTRIFLSMGNDEEFISDEVGMSLNSMKDLYAFFLLMNMCFYYLWEKTISTATNKQTTIQIFSFKIIGKQINILPCGRLVGKINYFFYNHDVQK